MKTRGFAAAAALLIAAGYGAPTLAQSKTGDVLRAVGAVADAMSPRPMVLPRAVVAEGQVLSPYAVASILGAQRYRVNDMRRQGYAYAVDATGPRGNRVILLVDGRSGVLLGQKVARWAPGVQRVTVAPRGGWNDAWEFGAVIPEKSFHGWAPIGQVVWTRAGPRTVPTRASYVAYRAAVPHRAVAVTRHGRTVAHPGKHGGYHVKHHDGRPVAHLDAAEDAEVKRMLAEHDADEAELRAIDAEDRANEALDDRDDANATTEAALDYADEQAAEAAESQRQLEDTQQDLDDANRTTEEQGAELDEARAREDERNTQDAEAADAEAAQREAESAQAEADAQAAEAEAAQAEADAQAEAEAQAQAEAEAQAQDDPPPDDNFMEFDSGGGDDPGED